MYYRLLSFGATAYVKLENSRAIALPVILWLFDAKLSVHRMKRARR